MKDLLKFYNDIPEGKENAVSYSYLRSKWHMSDRGVRQMLHDLSRVDFGDSFVLIRSSHGKGFYKTDNLEEIKQYKRECENRAKKIFLTVRKARRIIKESEG